MAFARHSWTPPASTAGHRGSRRQAARYLALQQRMARQHKKSAKRERTRHGMAVIAAGTRTGARDWAEKISTRLSANDLIVLEKLNTGHDDARSEARPGSAGAFLPNRARAKAGLSRGILASAWGALGRRLGEKAAASGVTVVQIDPRFTSQECRMCGHSTPGNRESQAVFRCQRVWPR